MSPACCCNCPDKFQQNSATEAQWQQLQSLLRGNCHPYHSSFSDIPHLLSTAIDDLQRCNGEIAKQQLYLASLQKQQKILERHVQGYQSLISPIRKVPPEILQQIFILVCTENRFDRDEINIPGLILSQVCSHWRLVCFDTTEVWSTISICTAQSHPCSNQAVRFLLKRSDPSPLKLKINGLSDTGRARDLLGALAAESNRWSELTLGLGNMTLFVEVFAVIKSRLPILRSLTLPYLADKFPELDLFQVAPRLGTFNFDPDAQDICVPWTQLRSLTLRGPTRPIQLLSRCPMLVSVELIRPIDRGVEFDDMPTESSLSSLMIEIDTNHILRGVPLLSQLTLPSLDSLSITRDPLYLPNFGQVFPIAQLQSLFSRSRCTITDLSWINIPTNFTQWITLLHSLHSLQSLSIEDLARVNNCGDYLVNDDFFDLLSAPTDSSFFLPSLQHLFLKVTAQNAAFSTSRLIRALNIRRSSEKERKFVPLKSFKLLLTRDSFDAQHLKPLKELAGSGLDMVIRDRSGVVLC
ncbi:hypothetical protein C8J56DRAFT_931286 [Mycena floridula]|nr:hypothetical protein C8J56DRAFT_931286 [Mycena floridula]